MTNLIVGARASDAEQDLTARTDALFAAMASAVVDAGLPRSGFRSICISQRL